MKSAAIESLVERPGQLSLNIYFKICLFSSDYYFAAITGESSETADVGFSISNYVRSRSSTHVTVVHM